MESLIEIPREDWPKLMDLFSKNWPHGVDAYCLLDTQLSYPTLEAAFNFKVYCPEGNMKNGMIAVLGNAFYQVYVCPIDENTTNIEKALVNTKVIDWSRNVMVASANTQLQPCLTNLCARLGLNIKYSDSKFSKHLLSKGSKLLEITNFPENTSFGPLKPEYIDLVDRTWTFHSPGSRVIFEEFLKNDLAWVLYSKENNVPVSWILVSEVGSFMHLYCLEEHRRKGYAEYVTKLATNRLLEQGKNVLAYTFEVNTASQNLFNKLGFEFVEYVWWVQLSKK